MGTHQPQLELQRDDVPPDACGISSPDLSIWWVCQLEVTKERISAISGFSRNPGISAVAHGYKAGSLSVKSTGPSFCTPTSAKPGLQGPRGGHVCRAIWSPGNRSAPGELLEPTRCWLRGRPGGLAGPTASVPPGALSARPPSPEARKKPAPFSLLPG